MNTKQKISAVARLRDGSIALLYAGGRLVKVAPDGTVTVAPVPDNRQPKDKAPH